MISKKTTIINILREMGLFKAIIDRLVFIGKALGVIVAFLIGVFSYTCMFYAINTTKTTNEGDFWTSFAFDYYAVNPTKAANEEAFWSSLAFACLVVSLLVGFVWFVGCMEGLDYKKIVRDFISAENRIKQIIALSSFIVSVLIGYFIGNYVIDSTEFRLHNSILNTFIGINYALLGLLIIFTVLALLGGIFWILSYPFRCLGINFMALNALTYMPTTEEDIKNLNITDYLEFERYLIHIFHGEKKSSVAVTVKVCGTIRMAIKDSLLTFLNMYGYEDDKLAELRPYPESIKEFVNCRAIEVSYPCFRGVIIKDLEANLNATVATLADRFKVMAESRQRNKEIEYFRQTLNQITAQEREVFHSHQ